MLGDVEVLYALSALNQKQNQRFGERGLNFISINLSSSPGTSALPLAKLAVMPLASQRLPDFLKMDGCMVRYQIVSANTNLIPIFPLTRHPEHHNPDYEFLLCLGDTLHTTRSAGVTILHPLKSTQFN